MLEKVNYKQFGISKEERDQERRDVAHNGLRKYILALKGKELGSLKCEVCGHTKDLDIHHKRYGKDVTYYDLMLLCMDCHGSIYPNRHES